MNTNPGNGSRTITNLKYKNKLHNNTNLVKAADVLDLLERWQDPFVVFLQLLHTEAKPAILLLISVIISRFN